MAINDKPCDTCAHYDPVMRGQTAKGGLRETSWAWCAKKSQYPAKEGAGQRFPPGVSRVAVGELAKPVIIRKGQVQVNCGDFTPPTQSRTKGELLKQLSAKTEGGRITGH